MKVLVAAFNQEKALLSDYTTSNFAKVCLKLYASPSSTMASIPPKREPCNLMAGTHIGDSAGFFQVILDDILSWEKLIFALNHQ